MDEQLAHIYKPIVANAWRMLVQQQNGLFDCGLHLPTMLLVETVVNGSTLIKTRCMQGHLVSCLSLPTAWNHKENWILYLLEVMQ